MTPSNQSRFWRTIGFNQDPAPAANHDAFKRQQKEQELLKAVRSGDHAHVRLLINEGVDVKTTSKNYKTCLHWALEKNDVQLVQDLLAAGAVVNCHDSSMYSPLQLAIESGNLELVKLLLNAGANVNDQALHVAVESQCKDIVEILLIRGADPNETVGHGESVLYRAAESRGPKSDSNDRAYNEILKLLLDYGASMLNDESQMIFKPFEAVLKFGTVAAIRLFLKNGLDLSNCGVPLPLHCAARNGDDVLEFLLKQKRFNIEDEDARGFTVLHEAVVHNNTDCVELLLCLGAKVDCPNGDDRTPLFTAVSNNFIDCAKLLLDSGANVNHPYYLNSTELRMKKLNFQTPWYIALSDNHSECVELLLACSINNALSVVQPQHVAIRLSPEQRRALRIHDEFFWVKLKFSPIILQKINLETMKTIVRRIAVLEFEKREINEDYYWLMNKFDEKHNNQNLMKYLNDCKLELSILMDSVIHESLTLYDILANKKILKSLLTTPSLIKFFKTSCPSKIFPIYGKQMENQYSEAKDLLKATDGALLGLSKILPFDVHAFHMITENILSRLYKRDLQNLREV